MFKDKMRRVLIIKNINSQFVDEAIVFLKSDIKKTSKGSLNLNKLDKDYVVNESINVINSYIERNYLLAEKKDKLLNKFEKKGKNKKNYFTIMLNIALFLSIMLLIYLISRAF